MRLFLFPNGLISLASLNLDDKADKGENANHCKTNDHAIEGDHINHAKLNIKDLGDAVCTESGKTEHFNPLAKQDSKKNNNCCCSACEDEVACEVCHKCTRVYKVIRNVSKCYNVNYHVKHFTKENCNNTYHDTNDPTEVCKNCMQISKNGNKVNHRCRIAKEECSKELLHAKKTLTKEKLNKSKSNKDVRNKGMNHGEHAPQRVPKCFNLAGETAIPEIFEELTDGTKVIFCRENLIKEFHFILFPGTPNTRPCSV